MSTGASVGSIYSQMILDTSQYEKALRDIVGLTKKGSDQSATSFDKTGKAVDQTTSKIKEQNKSVGGLASSLTALGGILGSAAIVGGLKSMVMEAGKMESVNTSFKVMLGSAEKAKVVLADLNKFSLDTPFTPTQVFQAGKALTAFGVEAKALTPTLKMVGDVAAGTGKDFNELSVIYGKAFIAGNIYAEDLNQLMEAGVPIISELSKVMNIQENQVKKMASEGKIGFKEMELAFQGMTDQGGRFFGMMDEQSKTLEGQLSTMQGNFTDLSIVIGEALLPTVKSLVSVLSSIVKGITSFSKENPVLFSTIVKLTAGLAALVALMIGGAGLKIAIMQIIPLLKTLGIVSVQTGSKIAFAFGPLGAAFLAITAILGLISQAEDRLNRLKAASVDRVNKALAGASTEQLEDAKKMLIMLQSAKRGVTQNTEAYNNYNKSLKAVGLSIEDISRGTEETRKNEIRFVIDKDGLKDQIKAVEQMIEASKEKMGDIIPTPKTGGTGEVVVEDEVKVEIKPNIDTGMFESLKGQMAGQFPEFEKFLATGLGGAMQGALAAVSMGVEIALTTLENKAALARVRLQNQTQQLDFWSAFADRAIAEDTRKFNESLDSEADALERQKADLLRIEQEYQLRRQEMRDGEVAAIRARIEQEYQLEAQRLQREYEEEQVRREEQNYSQESAAANSERLEEDHLLTLEDLRYRYNDMTEAEIMALNDRMTAEDSKFKESQVSKEEALLTKLAAIEAKKEEQNKKAEEEKKRIARDNSRLQWLLGMQAFAIEKQGNIAKAKVAGAMMVMQITAAAFSALPFTLPLLGYIPAAISAAGMGIAAASSAQYPPPPAEAFAQGGMVTGGTPGRDSVPAMLMPGELVVPQKNFQEVVNAYANSQGGSGGMNFNPTFNIYEQTNAQELASQTMEILYRETRNAQAAMI